MSQEIEFQLMEALSSLIKEEIENFEFTDLEVDAENVKGLEEAIGTYLEDNNNELEILAQNADRLDQSIEEYISENGIEVEEIKNFDEAILNALQNHDDIHGWTKEMVRKELLSALKENIEIQSWFKEQALRMVQRNSLIMEETQVIRREIQQIAKEVFSNAIERTGLRFWSYLSPVYWWNRFCSV